MRATARIYSRILIAGFRRQSAYLLAAWGGLLANTTFGLLKVAVLFATVKAAGGRLKGYDIDQMSTYIWVSQGLLGSVNLFGHSDIALRIKDGQIAVDFLRPLDVQAAAITHEVGKSLFALIPRGIPSLLIGMLCVGMALPHSLAPYLLGALSILLGIILSAATVYLIAAAGFWWVETRGLQILYMVLSGFLAGLFVPISLFPSWLTTLAQATPFPSMMMVPIDILSGRADTAAALWLVAIQLAWVGAVCALGQSLTRAGRRHLEVQGG